MLNILKNPWFIGSAMVVVMSLVFIGTGSIFQKTGVAAAADSAGVSAPTPSTGSACGCGAGAACGGTCGAKSCGCGSSCSMNQNR